MADQALKNLIQSGLQAAKAGGDVAQKATADIEADASDAGLKSALQAGNATSAQWKQRVEAAIAETGDAQDVGNPVLEAHFQVSRTIRQKASDAMSRDLGIIAAGQLALHYWIATFGTLRTYAAAANLPTTEKNMQQCLDEAKQADHQHTQLAEKMLSVPV